MSLIALGVTGGIGAYKAVEVARGLQKRGHDVVAIMTRTAEKFVGPLTFEAITRRRVITDQFAAGMNADIEHIQIASDIALLVVAPATAHVIARFAGGLADDFLSALYLATRAPVLMAPAMNTNMLAHPATAANLALLASRGVRFVDPGEGFLACGWIGKGRLAEPEAIVAAAEAMLSSERSAAVARIADAPRGPLHGRRVVVTAGPTFEDIDPVRFIGNRSSGRMGYAIAAEAAARGAATTLITGPTALPVPEVSDVVKVRSAGEMHDAVMRASGGADVIVMAAAVADFTPSAAEPRKIAKGPPADGLTLTLVRTRDILADLGRERGDGGWPVLVGFAAETHDTIAHARAKLAAKRADLIVANDVSRADAGFDVDTNAVTLVSRDGEVDVPLGLKAAVAARILDRVEALLAGVSHAARG
jgi:phosphopantothenoylcysteine decarboxylase/phosphopantothenate--cysteine ligase